MFVTFLNSDIFLKGFVEHVCSFSAPSDTHTGLQLMIIVIIDSSFDYFQFFKCQKMVKKVDHSFKKHRSQPKRYSVYCLRKQKKPENMNI